MRKGDCSLFNTDDSLSDVEAPAYQIGDMSIVGCQENYIRSSAQQLSELCKQLAERQNRHHERMHFPKYHPTSNSLPEQARRAPAGRESPDEFRSAGSSVERLVDLPSDSPVEQRVPSTKSAYQQTHPQQLPSISSTNSRDIKAKRNTNTTHAKVHHLHVYHHRVANPGRSVGCTASRQYRRSAEQERCYQRLLAYKNELRR